MHFSCGNQRYPISITAAICPTVAISNVILYAPEVNNNTFTLIWSRKGSMAEY